MRHPGNSVVVFAVWEPILPTDWSKPNTSALARLNDHRVRQYWDANHTVAMLLSNAQQSGKLHPNCCESKGHLWDLIAAYAAGSQWHETPPEPILLNGPIVRRVTELESAVAKAK